jgi:alcohol dehydrogenase class IV
MESFEYNVNASRVIFGSGSITQLPVEIAKLNCSAPLLLLTPRQSTQSEKLKAILKDGSIELAGVFQNATMHTPTHITEQAVRMLKDTSADCVISVGGGSVVGLGKAVSIRTGVPHLTIPTTYSGSEMTPILGETHEGRKTTRSDKGILPATVIYDVDLTMSLPPPTCVVSGVNAIAHAIEALYAKNTNPIISLLACEGVKALAESLPQIVSEPSSKPARERALYGAWLCGTCLGSTSMALHHKLCHTLGGSFGLKHAETHTVVLPHALSYNAPAIPELMTKLATLFPDSQGDALKGLDLLLGRLNAPRALKDLGMEERDIDIAADIAMSNEYPNPRNLEREPIRELIRRAWSGESARVEGL